MSLVRLEPQEDFRAGAFRAPARHLIPTTGAYTMQNLLLTEDGSIYKRGGSVNLSTAAFGSSLRWGWDGFLVGGDRPVSRTVHCRFDAAALDVDP